MPARTSGKPLGSASGNGEERVEATRIHTYNKIRDLVMQARERPVSPDNIDSPQIVVIFNPGSGKRSILENSLPREGARMVTTGCPIEPVNRAGIFPSSAAPNDVLNKTP